MSFAIFADPARDFNDGVLKLDEYADYWISLPQDLLIEVRDGYCVAGGYFSDYQSAINAQGSFGEYPEFLPALTEILERRDGQPIEPGMQWQHCVLKRDVLEETIIRKAAEFKR